MENSMEIDQDVKRENFLNKVQELKNQGLLTPGTVAKLDENQKMNIIFDIDHTLIIALGHNLYPNLYQDYQDQYGKNLHKISLNTGKGQKAEMWLVVRYGVIEMLDYLQTFCNFYVNLF